MSRYIELAHSLHLPAAVAATPAVPDAAPRTGAAPRIAPQGTTFIVKLRNSDTRSWGNQTEVVAASAQDAAEQLAGERLTGGSGERDHLRARVWAAPYGSAPNILFYVNAPVQASIPERDEGAQPPSESRPASLRDDPPVRRMMHA